MTSKCHQSESSVSESRVIKNTVNNYLNVCTFQCLYTQINLFLQSILFLAVCVMCYVVTYQSTFKVRDLWVWNVWSNFALGDNLKRFSSSAHFSIHKYENMHVWFYKLTKKERKKKIKWINFQVNSTLFSRVRFSISWWLSFINIYMTSLFLYVFIV